SRYWSSDVCSSDLTQHQDQGHQGPRRPAAPHPPRGAAARPQRHPAPRDPYGRTTLRTDTDRYQLNVRVRAEIFPPRHIPHPMPFYHSLGNIPHKRHTVFQSPEGRHYYEQLFGTVGFDGMSSLLYHVHRPTQVKQIVGSTDVAPKVA